jgi:hypothetical protein
VVGQSPDYKPKPYVPHIVADALAEKNIAVSDDNVYTAETVRGEYNVNEGQSVAHHPVRRSKKQIQMEINIKKDEIKRISEESQDPDDLVTAAEIEREIQALWAEWNEAE